MCWLLGGLEDATLKCSGSSRLQPYISISSPKHTVWNASALTFEGLPPVRTSLIRNGTNTEGKRCTAPCRESKESPSCLCKLSQELLESLPQHLFCFIAFEALQFSIQKISAEGYTTFILATVPPPSQGTLRHLANMSVSWCSLWPVLQYQQKPTLYSRHSYHHSLFHLEKQKNTVLLNKLLQVLPCWCMWHLYNGVLCPALQYTSKASLVQV